MKFIVTLSLLISQLAFASTQPSAGEIPEAKYQKIFENHLKYLKYLDEVNKPAIILFSGTQAMGKSFLARKIEDEFRGLRISNNVIRSYMVEFGLEVTRENVSKYSEYFFSKIGKYTKNSLIILDSSVCRKYEKIKKMFASKGIKESFLIRIDLDYEEARRRLHERNDASMVLPYFDNYIQQHREFGQKHANDIDVTLTETVQLTDAQIAALYQKIRQKLKIPTR